MANILKVFCPAKEINSRRVIIQEEFITVVRIEYKMSVLIFLAKVTLANPTNHYSMEIIRSYFCPMI